MFSRLKPGVQACALLGAVQVVVVLAAVMRAKLEIVTAVDKAEIAGGATEERLHAWVPESLRRMCDLSETVLCSYGAERIIERLRAGRRTWWCWAPKPSLPGIHDPRTDHGAGDALQPLYCAPGPALATSGTGRGGTRQTRQLIAES